MSTSNEQELEEQMLKRVGILPKKPRLLTEEILSKHPKDTLFLSTSLLANLLSEAILTSVEKEIPVIERIERLEKKIEELKTDKDAEKFSKADLIYFKFKNELEKKHFGKIVAIDKDSEQIVGVGNSVLEAYSEAKKKSSKKQFSYRRVGYDFVHRL